MPSSGVSSGWPVLMGAERAARGRRPDLQPGLVGEGEPDGLGASAFLQEAVEGPSAAAGCGEHLARRDVHVALAAHALVDPGLEGRLDDEGASEVDEERRAGRIVAAEGLQHVLSGGAVPDHRGQRHDAVAQGAVALPRQAAFALRRDAGAVAVDGEHPAEGQVARRRRGDEAELDPLQLFQQGFHGDAGLRAEQAELALGVDPYAGQVTAGFHQHDAALAVLAAFQQQRGPVVTHAARAHLEAVLPGPVDHRENLFVGARGAAPEVVGGDFPRPVAERPPIKFEAGRKACRRRTTAGGGFGGLDDEGRGPAGHQADRAERGTLAEEAAARQAAGFLVGIADEGVGVLDEVVHGGSPDRGAGRPFPVAGS